MTFLIEEHDRDHLQRLGIALESTQAIICRIITENLDISTDRFNDYQSRYESLYKDFEDAKQMINEKYILNNPEFKDKPLHWDLDYRTCTITVTFDV